jgi:hypothetical protein
MSGDKDAKSQYPNTKLQPWKTVGSIMVVLTPKATTPTLNPSY